MGKNSMSTSTVDRVEGGRKKKKAPRSDQGALGKRVADVRKVQAGRGETHHAGAVRGLVSAVT